MRPLTSALYTAPVAGKPVRFFAPPEGAPDFPWHVADDLFAALRFPRAVRRHFQQSLRAEHASSIRTVATADGIVTIVPHFMAQGAIGAGEDIGCAPYEAAADYTRAGVRALNIQSDRLGLKGMDRVAYAAEAFRRGQR